MSSFYFPLPRSPTFEGPFASTLVTNNMYYNDVSSVNVHSDEFGNLPPEVQHEILLERQQIEKYSYHDPDTLPQVLYMQVAAQMIEKLVSLSLSLSLSLSVGSKRFLQLSTFSFDEEKSHLSEAG